MGCPTPCFCRPLPIHPNASPDFCHNLTACHNHSLLAAVGGDPGATLGVAAVADGADDVLCDCVAGDCGIGVVDADGDGGDGCMFAEDDGDGDDGTDFDLDDGVAVAAKLPPLLQGLLLRARDQF